MNSHINNEEICLCEACQEKRMIENRKVGRNVVAAMVLAYALAAVMIYLLLRQ